MIKENILDAALKIIEKENSLQDEELKNNFKLASELWSIYLKEKCVSPGTEVTVLSEDIAALQALLKIANISNGNENIDNWIYLAGYAACGGEFQTGDNKLDETSE